MNVIERIITSIRYKLTRALDKEGNLLIAYKKYGEAQLLYKGRVKSRDIMWASENLINDKSCQSSYLYAKGVDGKFYIYDTLGKNLTPKGLYIENDKNIDMTKPLNTDLVGMKQADGKILVIWPNVDKYVILNPTDRTISPTYKQVSELNQQNGQRKIKFPNGLQYYIDSDFKLVSYPFLNETPVDEFGNRIQTTYDTRGDNVQVLVDANHKWISNFYDKITKPANSPYYEAYKERSRSRHFLTPKGTEALNTKTNSKFVLTDNLPQNEDSM